MMVACFPPIMVMGVSLLAMALLFFFYPLLLLMVGSRRPGIKVSDPEEWPRISVVVVVRNGEKWVDRKVDNLLSCHYPREKLEILFHSDASEDGTEALLSGYSPQVSFTATREHMGKNHGLNLAAEQATGEILVFSDADALLDPGALMRLAAHFSDPGVGGVCGQRVIRKETAALAQAQGRYIRLDSAIKALESRLGRLTSNDGKLYAIRARAFLPIPDGVTDDLYNALSVMGQGFRFLFEPQARAFIATPSRSPGHELSRRRRIVARSLHGIFLHRRLLNPFSFGIFSLGLLINKVLRRLLPLLLLLFFLANGLAFSCHPFLSLLFLGQVGFYGLALLYPVFPERLGKRLETLFYFCLGNLGSLFGVWDFLRGRFPARWDPIKG